MRRPLARAGPGVLAAIALMGWLASSIALAQSPAPEPEGIPRIYHKGRNFRIPFNLSAEGRDKVREVHLLVSEDRGYHWTAKSKTFPDHPTFTFRSSKDGEYWFAVQTVTTDGRVAPRLDATIEPNLKVVVDTLRPTILLDADGRRGSVAAVRWETRDENLDLKTLVIEYQVEGVGVWRRVPVRRLAATGSISWDTGTAEALKVRGSVADKAGNVAESVIDLPEGTASSPADSASGVAFAGDPALEKFPGSAQPEISAAPDFSPVGEDLAPPEKPRNPRASQPRTRTSGGVARTASAPGRPSRTETEPVARAEPAVVDLFAASGGQTLASAANPLPPAAEPKARANSPAAPQAGSTLLVGGSKFALQYAVDDAGPEGPASVEIWITRDGGRTWIRRGEDPDHVSPIEVDLGGEGTYGVSLVARSASGVGDQPPAPGDSPQSWVEVDSSPPLVNMRPPQVGTGLNAGKVALSWTASDLHLTPRSVSIFWRPEKSGSEWQLVAAGLESEGRYIWNVPATVPDRFHLRIEATDSVGHHGGIETTDSGPISIDRSRPRSRIIGLDPSSRSGAGNPERALR